uniref:Uncharacterized protein n=1 Tax=Eutreptiella gymnastica TaxID=73025 RepID=A0A7S4G814_9EUGL
MATQTLTFTCVHWRKCRGGPDCKQQKRLRWIEATWQSPNASVLGLFVVASGKGAQARSLGLNGWFVGLRNLRRALAGSQSSSNNGVGTSKPKASYTSSLYFTWASMSG